MLLKTMVAVLWLAPASSAQSQFALSDLERAGGWVSMSDEASRSSWEKPGEGWSFEGLVLRRAAGAKDHLGWNGVLAEFEIDFDWRESPAKDTPWQSGRVVVRRDNSGLALLGETRIDREADSDLPSFRAGPFEMTPAQSQPGWHVALGPGATALELRGMRLRDRAKPLGKSVEIFDSKSLNGWRALGDAKFSVDHGELLGEVGGGSQSFLCSQELFADFILELELKNELPGNSGIQVRSHENEQSRLFGYQIEIDPSARAWSGGLYDEARRGWLDDLSDNPHGRAAFKNGEWNRYRIECIGPWIRAWVNDVPTADYLDAKDLEGAIGLQVHSGRDTKIRWRNFRLRHLGRSNWAEFDIASNARVLASGNDRVNSVGNREDGISLGAAGGGLLLRYSFYSAEPDVLTPIENLRLLGPDWSIPVPLRSQGLPGNEVLILCYPPRVAIEVDGRRIAPLNFGPAGKEPLKRPIEAWIEYSSAQKLDMPMALGRD